MGLYLKLNLKNVLCVMLPILVTCAGLATSYDIEFYHNEGYSIWCARQNLFDLLHPGLDKIAGCTYDHQPLYFILLKLYDSLVSFDVFYYRLPSVIFFLTGFLVLMKRFVFIEQRKGMAFILLIIIYSNVYFAIVSSQIRMYSLFYLFSILQITSYDRIDKDDSILKLLILSIFAGFIFYASHLLSFLLMISLLLKFGIKQFKKNYLILGFYLLSFLYKLPSLYHWRIVNRAKEAPDLLTTDDFYSNFIENLFGENLFYQLLISFLFILYISKLKIRKERYLFSGAVGVILFIGSLRYSLDLAEIEIRYILFIPILLGYCLLKEKLIGTKVASLLLGICLYFTIYSYNDFKVERKRLRDGSYYDQRNISFEKNVLANTRVPLADSCIMDWDWSIKFYKLIYYQLENNFDIEFCDYNSQEKNILSLRSDLTIGRKIFLGTWKDRKLYMYERD